MDFVLHQRVIRKMFFILYPYALNIYVARLPLSIICKLVTPVLKKNKTAYKPKSLRGKHVEVENLSSWRLRE